MTDKTKILYFIPVLLPKYVVYWIEQYCFEPEPAKWQAPAHGAPAAANHFGFLPEGGRQHLPAVAAIRFLHSQPALHEDALLAADLAVKQEPATQGKRH